MNKEIQYNTASCQSAEQSCSPETIFDCGYTEYCSSVTVIMSLYYTNT